VSVAAKVVCWVGNVVKTREVVVGVRRLELAIS
jgi:hypothetical protein